MKQLFINYFTIFIHPIKSYNYFYEERNGFNNEESDFVVHKPKFWEIIGVSWIFVIISAIYDLAGIGLAVNFTELLGGPMPSAQETAATAAGTMIATIATTILFPLIAFLSIKVMSFFYSLFGNMLSNDEKVDVEMYESVILYSYVTNALLLIPAIGTGLFGFTSLIFIIIGFHKSLRFTKLQSVLLALLPSIAIVLLGILIILGGTLFVYSLS